MLRVIRERLRLGRLTEADPRGGGALAWVPHVAQPGPVPAGVCPTSALDPRNPATLDLGACIFCGACGRAGLVEWEPGVPEPQQRHVPLVVGTRAEPLRELKRRLRDLRGVFGRSLGVRVVSVGSCNGCEVEVGATMSPFFDLERFGVRFVASPRHADVLLVTGVVTRNLAAALVRTVEATPQPRAVVALGACGMSGGIFAGSPHVVGGVARLVKVDVVVPGCPPPPESILAGVVEAGRILSERHRGRATPSAQASA
ncbi:MAG TPA: NADH-quinone oxidoreductase subunit NuoB [Candidatus Thermoplasmatota archaeon]|nr:NADH-quinone oxidoreductase subunit NuoB [Candidatus Thermoplasmatota archaeon]